MAKQKRPEAPLGSGQAERARKDLKDRKRRLDEILDKSSKRGGAASRALLS